MRNVDCGMRNGKLPPAVVVFAAALVLASLVYVMAAQAFGPELALPVPSALM